jgi:hypothetical protein
MGPFRLPTPPTPARQRHVRAGRHRIFGVLTDARSATLSVSSGRDSPGLQVALPIALIVAEMLMGGYGLGGAMVHAPRFADSQGLAMLNR